MPLPVNRHPNKLAPNVPNDMVRNLPFCFIISLTPFINKLDSSRDSLEIINFICAPDPQIFLCIPAFAAAAINPNGTKTH